MTCPTCSGTRTRIRVRARDLETDEPTILDYSACPDCGPAARQAEVRLRRKLRRLRAAQRAAQEAQKRAGATVPEFEPLLSEIERAGRALRESVETR